MLIIIIVSIITVYFHYRTSSTL